LLLPVVSPTPCVALDEVPPQKVEEACGLERPDVYKAALDEAVGRVERRALQWDLEEVESFRFPVRPLRKSMIENDPERCERGELHNMAIAARSKGAGGLDAEVATVLALRRENLTDGCL
jgi:hypothetical protein